MLTIFTVPKPFEGHIGTIQRNALRSWTQLRPQCQVIICGDEVGSRTNAAELGVEQIADVERNEFGTPLLNSVFELVEESATNDLLCYVNADLILRSDFLDAVHRVSQLKQRFLVVGETWDLDVADETVTTAAGWEDELRHMAARSGSPRPSSWIDYFVYPRGLIGPLPPFAVGRPAWDNWMIYRARRLGAVIVDISASTLVIHQHHDYSHVKHARADRWQGPEGDNNVALLGDPRLQRFTLDDATHRLSPTGLVRTDFKTRVQGEMLIHPWIVPLYRAARPIYRLFRMLPRARSAGP
jgi:hypothetical protein